MKMNLQKNMFDRRLRYKMYKDGKKWVFASMATLSLIGAFLAGGTAHADDQDVDHSQTVDTSEQGNAPNSESVVVLSATPASSDATSEIVASSASEASSSAQTSSADAKGETSASLSAQSEALQSSDARTGETRSVASETSATSSVATSSVASSASQASSAASSTASSTAVSSVASSAAGASYSVDSAKSVAVVVTSIVAEMHSVAAADSAAIAASTTDNVVRNTAMEALVAHVVEEASGVAQSLNSAQYQADHVKVEYANMLMMTVYNVVNNMTFELQQAIQMAAADKRGVQEDVLERAQTAYVNLDVSRFNASAKLSAYGDLIVDAPTNQFAKVVADLKATGLYDDFRFVVDPVLDIAINNATNATTDAGKTDKANILGYNATQIYNEFVTGGTASKTTTSTAKEGTGLTTWTSNPSDDPTTTKKDGYANPMTAKNMTDSEIQDQLNSTQITADSKDDTQYYNLTGVKTSSGYEAAVKPVAGNVTYKYQMSLSGNFTITGKFFMSNHSDSRVTKLPTVAGQQNAFQGGAAYPAGDFLGLFLSPTDPGTVGGTNGDLGIGGLPDAVAFGIDFFYNSNKGDQQFGGYTNETALKNNYPVVGFRTTDSTGTLTNGSTTGTYSGAGYSGTGGLMYTKNTSSGSTYSSTTQNTVPQSILTTGLPYFLSYDAKTHILTASLPKPGSDSTPDASTDYVTWQYKLSDALLARGVLSIGLLGVTGGNGAVMQASIDVSQTDLVTGKEMNFTGALVGKQVTVHYVDANGNKLADDTSFTANVGSKIGVANISPNYTIDDVAYGAPDMGSLGIDSSKYNLISANDVTVSGSKSNDITLVYGTRQTATVRYLLQDPVTNATSRASLSDVVLNGWSNQAFSTAANYNKITTSVPGYSVNTYYLTHDANFDTIDDATKTQMIYLYLVPNKQTVTTTVKGLPTSYTKQIQDGTTTQSVYTDAVYNVVTPDDVAGYSVQVTDASGKVVYSKPYNDKATVNKLSNILVPAAAANTNTAYTITYTALSDSVKVFFTYTDPATHQKKPIDTKLIGLKTIANQPIQYTADGAPYIVMTGVTDQTVNFADIENVAGGYSWDGQTPTVTNSKTKTTSTAVVMTPDVEDAVTVNFTQAEVIATIYYLVERKDAKGNTYYERFAPLGSGTASTFIYKGYANTAMPADPATESQLYPSVSGYKFVRMNDGDNKEVVDATDANGVTNVLSQLPINVTSDTPIDDTPVGQLTDADYLLTAGHASTKILTVNNWNNNVFVIYQAQPQTALVRYVDQNGNAVPVPDSAPKTITGYTGADYLKFGSYTDKNKMTQAVTKEILTPSVTGYDTPTITDTASVAGKVNSGKVDSEGQIIWTPQSVEVTNSGVFGTQNTTVITVVYQAQPQRATVSYVDNNGRAVIYTDASGKPYSKTDVTGNVVDFGVNPDLPTELSGTTNENLVGKVTDAMKKAPAGYAYASTTADAVFDDKPDNQGDTQQVKVNFIAQAQTATVKYVYGTVDANGKFTALGNVPNNLAVSLQGVTGQKLEDASQYGDAVTNKKIAGYTRVGIEQGNGVFLAGDNTITVEYTADEATLRVLYYLLDSDNKANSYQMSTRDSKLMWPGDVPTGLTADQLADYQKTYTFEPGGTPAISLTALQGLHTDDKITLTNPSFKGYTLSTVDTDLSGLTLLSDGSYAVKAGTNAIAYYFRANMQIANVAFVDQQGNPIKGQDTRQVSGPSDSPINTDNKIQGWTKTDDTISYFDDIDDVDGKSSQSTVNVPYAPDPQWRAIDVTYPAALGKENITTPVVTDKSWTGQQFGKFDLKDYIVPGYTLLVDGSAMNELPAEDADATDNALDATTDAQVQVRHITYRADAAPLVVHYYLQTADGKKTTTSVLPDSTYTDVKYVTDAVVDVTGLHAAVTAPTGYLVSDDMDVSGLKKSAAGVYTENVGTNEITFYLKANKAKIDVTYTSDNTADGLARFNDQVKQLNLTSSLEGYVGQNVNEVTGYEALLNQKVAGYSFGKATINGVDYNTLEGALAAVDELKIPTMDDQGNITNANNTIQITFAADEQRVNVEFYVNQYANVVENGVLTKKSIGSPEKMPGSDQQTITIAGRTNEAVSYAAIQKYLSDATSGFTKYVYDQTEGKNQAPSDQVSVFDADANVDQVVKLAYEGKSTTYVAILLSTDQASAFSSTKTTDFLGVQQYLKAADGTLIRDSKGNPISIVGKDTSGYLVPLGMGNNSTSIVKNLGNFSIAKSTTDTTPLIMVETTAGTENPWSNVMTISGTASAPAAAQTASGTGNSIVVVKVNNATIQLPGTTETIPYGSGVDSKGNPGQSTWNYFYVTMRVQKDANGQTVYVDEQTGKTYTAADLSSGKTVISRTETGLDLALDGYFYDTSGQNSISYPGVYYNGSYGYVSDQSPWAIAYTTLPSQVQAGDDNSAQWITSARDSTKPVYGVFYYLKDAMQRLDVSYKTTDGKSLHDTLSITGKANTDVSTSENYQDALDIDKALQSSGYRRVSTADPMAGLKFDTVGVLPQVDSSNHIKYDGKGNVLFDTNGDYVPQDVTYVYQPYVQQAKVKVQILDDAGKVVCEKEIPLADGIVGGTIDTSSVTQGMKGYHLVRNDLAKTNTYNATGGQDSGVDSDPDVLYLQYVRDKQAVQVNFVDANGKTLQNSVLLTNDDATSAGSKIDYATVVKTIPGYKTILSDATLAQTNFDLVDNHGEMGSDGTQAGFDATPKQLNIVYQADAAKINVVYRVQQMAQDGTPIPGVFKTVTPSGTQSSIVGNFDGTYTLQTYNPDLAKQGYTFDDTLSGAITWSDGKTETGVDTLGDVTTYPNGAGPDGITKQGAISKTYTFDENDTQDTARTVYVTYRPEKYVFDIVYLVVDSTGNHHDVLVQESGYAGGFYSYNSPTLPLPAYITAGADQGNLNGPYGPQVNGFGLVWDATAGKWTDPDGLDTLRDEHDNVISVKPHLVIRYTPKTMSVTANYVLVDKNGNPVKGVVDPSKPAEGDNLADVYVHGNAVSTGAMGNAIVEDKDWYAVDTNGTVDKTKEITNIEESIKGYKLVNAGGDWTSSALTFDFDADGDGAHDIVPATWQAYVKYAQDVYEPYRLKQNAEADAFNKANAVDIAAGKIAAESKLEAWNLDNIQSTWSELGWNQNNNYDAVEYNEAAKKFNVDNADQIKLGVEAGGLAERNIVDTTKTSIVHEYQPAVNYVTFKYQVDPTITYTYKDSKGNVIDKGETVEGADGNLRYKSDNSPYIIHVTPTMLVNGGGEYTVKDTEADIAGFTRSDSGALTFTAQPQKVVTSYVVDEANSAATKAALTDKLPGTDAVMVDPTTYNVAADGTKTAVAGTDYTVNATGKGAIPAGYIVSGISYNGKTIAVYNPTLKALVAGDDSAGTTVFTEAQEAVLAKSDAQPENDVVYTLLAKPQPLKVTYSYTTAGPTGWTAPKDAIKPSVAAPETVQTDDTYTVEVPTVDGYKASIKVTEADGTSTTYAATDFAKLTTADFTMPDGGRKYDVVYTPLQHNLNISYQMPANSVPMTQTTAPTQIVYTDQKVDLNKQFGNADGPLASLIPVGYRVSRIVVNGVDQAKQTWLDSGAVMQNADNTIVYVLSAMPQNLQVNYIFKNGNDNVSDAAKKKLDGLTFKQTTPAGNAYATTLDKNSYATNATFNLNVPTIDGYKAVVTMGGQSVSATNITMLGTGMTFDVTYVPQAQAVTKSFNGPAAALNRIAKADRTKVISDETTTATDLSFTVPADGPSDVPAGYKIDHITVDGKNVNSGDTFKVLAIVAGTTNNNIEYWLVPTEQLVTVDYQYIPTDETKYPNWQRPETTIEPGTTETKYATDSQYTIPVTVVPGYTAEIVEIAATATFSDAGVKTLNDYSGAQMAKTFTMDSVSHHYVVLYTPNKQTMNVYFKMAKVDANGNYDVTQADSFADANGAAPGQITGFSDESVDSAYVAKHVVSEGVDMPTVAGYKIANADKPYVPDARFDTDETKPQKAYYFYTPDKVQKANLTFTYAQGYDATAAPKLPAALSVKDGLTGTLVSFTKADGSTLKDADLYVPGYTYVISSPDNGYTSLTNLPKYTDADDVQEFTVTYTPIMQQVGFIQTGLDTTPAGLPKLVGYTGGKLGTDWAASAVDVDGNTEYGVVTANSSFDDVQPMLHVAGYEDPTFTVNYSDGTKDEIKTWAELKDVTLAMKAGATSDHELTVKSITVNYTKSNQEAVVRNLVGTGDAQVDNFAGKNWLGTGLSGTAITLNVTDADLAAFKPGYSYTVNGFATLADALANNAKYDYTDNGSATAADDSEKTYFDVVYTANQQSVPVNYVVKDSKGNTLSGDKLLFTKNFSNIVGKTDESFSDADVMTLTSDAMKQAGYAVAILDSKGNAIPNTMNPDELIATLKSMSFSMATQAQWQDGFTVQYSPLATKAMVHYQVDASVTNKPTVSADTPINGFVGENYEFNAIPKIPGYTILVTRDDGALNDKGNYDATQNSISGTFNAADIAEDAVANYTVTYIPSSQNIKLHYDVTEPAGMSVPDNVILPGDSTPAVTTDTAYSLSSKPTPGYVISGVRVNNLDSSGNYVKTEYSLAEIENMPTKTVDQQTAGMKIYELPNGATVALSEFNAAGVPSVVTFGNTAKVANDGQLQTSSYDVVLTPTEQQYTADYSWADATAPHGDKTLHANVAATLVYTDQGYSLEVPGVAGYKVSVEGKAANGSLTGDIAKRIVNGKLALQMGSENIDYKIVYTALPQYIKISYDTSLLTDAELADVKAKQTDLTDGSIDGQTDLKLNDATNVTYANAMVNVPDGYIFMVVDAKGQVVDTTGASMTDDSKGPFLVDQAKTLDLSQLTNTFAVDADGKLLNDTYRVIYVPAMQDQDITFVTPVDPITNKATEVPALPQRSAGTKIAFGNLDLSAQEIPGYTMQIHKATATGELVTVDDLANELADSTAANFETNDKGEISSVDTAPQNYVVTYVANKDQKASLKIVNKPVSASDLSIVDPITNGETDAKVNFGITQKDLYVPGYTFVVTLDGDKDAEPVNIDDLFFTRDETDNQAYTVTYTPISQTVHVNYLPGGLTAEQQASVPGSVADFTLSGNTDTAYASATVSGATSAVVSGRPGYTFEITAGTGSSASVVVSSAASDTSYDFAGSSAGSFVVSGVADSMGVASSEGLVTPEYDVTYTALPQEMNVTYSVAGDVTDAQQKYVDATTTDNPKVMTATTDALLSVATATTMIIRHVDGYTFMIYKKKADGTRGEALDMKPQTSDFDLATNALTSGQLFAVGADGKLTMPGYDVVYTPDQQKATVVFKDLTTGETLTASEVALTGTSDGDMDFTDAKVTLAGLEAKHYYVVTDLPASEAFDHADNENQTITVELRHEIADHSETKTVTSTVTYEGVKPAQAASEKTATVTHTYQTDEVTDDRIQAADSAKYADDAKYKADTYAVATDDDATIDAQMGDLTFSDVKSPVVPGYTADKLTVQNKTATKVAADGTVGYDDVQSVVTYAPNDQTVKVHYDNTDLTPNQQNSVPNGGSDFTLTGKTDAPYETATVNGGPTTVPAVPGYTFTVTSNGKTTFTSDDKNPTYDFKSATDGHVFTVTEDGLTDGDYTITYTPNEVTGQVIVIDDEKNESIQTDNLNGKTDADVVYDSAATIKNFTDQGYVLVSNDLSDAKTYNADDANNRFEIHLKHNTADGTGTPTTTVRHTTITTPDGKTTTVDQTVEVTPHFSVDQVTKTRVPDGDLADKTKYDNTETPWFEENDKTPEGTVGVTDFDKKTGTPTFGDVDVPNVPGYTVVRTNEPNGDQTVTYTANEAKAQVVYVDDTTSDTLKTADIKGVTDAEMDYNSDDVIADYKSQGYVLVSDGFAEGTKYDNVDDSKTDSQVFEVHLKHNTADGTDTPTTVVRHTTITTPDGKTTTVDQTVDVTPHFSVDQVTKTRVPDEELDNDKKYDNTETPWFEENDKTPEGTVGATDFDKNTGTPTFGDVDVPDVPGYTIVRTPNDPAKPNGDQTVTYAANEAKVQVVYVDDVTGDTLKTVDVKGVTDAKIDYNSDDVIADYESQGYVLVSDGFAEGTKYDNIDDSKTDSQVFEVHLKHNTADGTGEPTTVVRHTTIKTPHGEPTTVDQTVEVTPHFSVDQVTKTRVPDDELNDKTKYDNTETPWFEEHDKTPTGTTGATDFDKNTGTPTFGDVDVPEVPGYTVVRTPNDPSQPNGDQTVTYTANGVTGQVVVIDDATGKPVQTDELTGNTDADVVYDSAATIKHFTDMGYVLVSNDLSDAKMYNADDAKNRFEIHLKHNTADGTGTPTTTVRHTTITTPDGKKTTVDQTIEITPHYSVDQVTGERVPDGDLDDKTKYDNTETPWFEEHDKTPDGTNGVTGFDKKTGTPTFGDVDVPEVPGYTPVRTSEPNGDQTVTYVANYVTGKVVVIDDVTGATLRTDDLAGKTDANVDYDSAATIKNFTDKGYVLVSNDLSDAKTYNFDAAKNVFEIHLKHDTMDGTGTPTTVVRHTTIQTPDGKTVTVEQIVEVTPHYSVDKVTGERVPDDQLGDDTKYANTETPWFESHDKTSTDITGMTGFDEKTGTPTFGEVAVPTIPGYKMVRTNEPNGDQVVTFVPDGSAVVETSNNVQPVATVATPQTTIATPSRMIPMNNVVAGTPAPTTNTVDGELPVFVETVNNTPVVNKDNLWIHEIPDDKDGDIANLNSLNDMSWRTSDPYLVAMLIAALAAAGMFGVLLAFYRRREAVERKLAERRED